MNNKWIIPFALTYGAVYLLFLCLDGLFSCFVHESEVAIGVGFSGCFFSMKYAIRCIPKGVEFFHSSIITAFLASSVINIGAACLVLFLIISGGIYLSDDIDAHLAPSMMVVYQMLSLLFITLSVKHYGKQRAIRCLN